MYLHILEARYEARASFKQSLRRAFFPILLALTGCGTQDKDQDKSDETDSTGGPISVTSPSQNHDTYTPSPRILADWENTIEKQISERGWGCSFTVSSAKTMVLTFKKRHTTGQNIYFSLLFLRDEQQNPWYLEEVRPIAPARLADDPETNQLKNDVMSVVETSLQDVKTKYGCNIDSSKWAI